MLVEEMLGGIRYSTYKVEHFDSARSVFGDWKLSLSTTLYLFSLTKLCRERWPKCMIAVELRYPQQPISITPL